MWTSNPFIWIPADHACLRLFSEILYSNNPFLHFMFTILSRHFFARYLLYPMFLTSQGASLISVRHRTKIGAWRELLGLCERRGTHRNLGFSGDLFEVCSLFLHWGYEGIYWPGKSDKLGCLNIFRNADYYLTTVFRNRQKSVESSRRKDSTVHFRPAEICLE